MVSDRQFWHYTDVRKIQEFPLERGVTLKLNSYRNLVLPDLSGARDVLVVFEEGQGGVRNAQWFPADDPNQAARHFRDRQGSASGSEPLSRPIERIDENWGECEVVAECRNKGADLVVSRGAGLFYVDVGGRRSQVRLDACAVVRYLAHALEDGS